MKESDASLDITNRTDGVPDMGDPFHDLNAEQKWAEWNTAPGVTQRVAKVDFSKENQLWYYLGKPSTEARPQYTEDPTKQRNNTKSSFLDTVKPPAPPVPVFAARSYPTTHSLKPAPIAVPPRTPVQYQLQPAGRPYQYKPKESYMTTWKSPVYNPDTRKNPNSPVAHQPNVSYDHRAPVQAYGQAQYHGYHHHRAPQQSQPQQYQYQPYVPPAAQPASSDPILNGIDQFAHSSQSKALPPYPYSPQASSHSPHQLPPNPFSQSQSQSQNGQPNYSPPVSNSSASQKPSGRGSISGMLSNPSGPPKPPMYAIAPSSSVVYAAQSPTEYLAYVKNYPYLKNAYLRRAKTYVSPYSPGGGFSQDWMPKLPTLGASTTIAPKATAPTSQGYYHGHTLPKLPPPRPTAQFQSSDAFQRDLARTSQPTDGAPKWEQILKQLATSTGPTALPTTTAVAPQAPQPRYPQSTSRSGLQYDIPRSMQPGPSHTPPLPPLRAPQRPTPSPISDDGKEAVGVSSGQGLPTLPPLQQLPPVHGAETWRYS
jgi:hypothetical protein